MISVRELLDEAGQLLEYWKDTYLVPTSVPPLPPIQPPPKLAELMSRTVQWKHERNIFLEGSFGEIRMEPSYKLLLDKIEEQARVLRVLEGVLKNGVRCIDCQYLTQDNKVWHSAGGKSSFIPL